MKSPTARFSRLLATAAVILACCAGVAYGQGKKKNPASKLYVSDVSGEAQIDTGDTIEDLNRRSVYSAQGSIVDTKKPEKEEDRSKYYTTMVYSNGTGAFFDADTRVEVRRFVQEPFLPMRSDMEVEPSISQTQAFVARGTVGLCTSKLVAGSTMAYTTPHGSVNIQGRKVVIQAEADVTKISMLEGESTVRAGTLDMGGHTLKAGQQAIIRPSAPGQPNSIQIVKIPSNEAAQLDDKVAMACMAKKTVYFEVRDRQRSNSDSGNPGEVDAFDTETQARTAGGPFVGSDGEIVAIPVAPADLPVHFTISPAAITTPNGRAVTPGNASPGGPPGN